jgi:hypothetical protein
MAMATLVDDHEARGGPRAAIPADSAKCARSLGDKLDAVRKRREAESAAHQAAPSQRTLQMARIEQILGIVRSAAFVLFADELPELYRTVTSQYQREARRNARHRAKSEPVPRVVSLAGSVVKRRPRRKAG